MPQNAGASSVGRESWTDYRAAFHPEEAGDLDDLDHAAGGGELVDQDWESAGPAAAEELWDRYKHDSGAEVTALPH